MNETTPLNSELLSADARGRKHIPVAVFAVIVIHVVLFVVLLIAAGCRSSARVKRNTPTPAASVEQRDMTRPPIPDPIAMQQTQPAVVSAEAAVVATEPQVEAEAPQQTVAQPERRVTQKNPVLRPTASKTNTKLPAKESKRTYVVKSGDTLEKIAKRYGTTIQAVRTANKMKTDMIRPGQKLLLATESARTASFQVASR